MTPDMMHMKTLYAYIQAIADFQGLIANIHKGSRAIEKSVAAIASAKLCPKLYRDGSLPVPDFNGLCDHIKQHQTKASFTLNLRPADSTSTFTSCSNTASPLDHS